MDTNNSQMQLVSFCLGNELYGIDIMSVKEIVRIQPIRPIPNSPNYMVGILNLRGEIIPIIDLHRRFNIDFADGEEELDELESGFIIVDIEGNKLGIIIDKVSRVITVSTAEIQVAPRMSGGIGSEYIKGVVRNNDSYLIILDIVKLFNPKELQKIIEIQK